MLNLIEQFMSNEQKKQEMQENPVLYATVMALYQYVAAGYRLSDLPWFKAIDFGDLEEALQKVA